MSRRKKRDHRNRSIYHRQLRLEQLEDRRMLSWLTVISHGNGSSPDAMEHIRDAVQSRYKEIGQPQAQEHKLSILPGDNASMTRGRFFATFPGANPLPDVDRIIQVDWSETANPFQGSGMADSIGGRLGLILGMLVNRQTNVEGIHLIGHSRGAFVVSTAAAVLNGGANSDLALLHAEGTQQVVTAFKQQQAVDRPAILHVTTLDPNPIPWPKTDDTSCLSYDSNQKAPSFIDGAHCVTDDGESDGVLVSTGVDLWENFFREGTIVGAKGFRAATTTSVEYRGVDHDGVDVKLPDEYLESHWLRTSLINRFAKHTAVHSWYAEANLAQDVASWPDELSQWYVDRHRPHTRSNTTLARWEFSNGDSAINDLDRPILLQVKQVTDSPTSSSAKINLEVASITDTSGTPNSSNPGLLKRSFLPGDTVRITLKADNTGAAVPILVTADVGLYRDHKPYSASSTFDSPLQTGELDYYSFDWTLPLDTVAGEYGILAAIQSPGSSALYDTTGPGRDDMFSPASWRPHQFRVLDSTPPATSPDITVQVGSQQIVDGQTDSVSFGSVDQGLHGEVQTFKVSNLGSGDLTLGTPTLPDGYHFLEGLDTELRPGETDTFTVLLETSNGGQYSGNVQIASNDPDEAQFSFPLSGQVLLRPTGDPEIAVEFIARPIQAGSTAPVFFGSQKQGDPGISYSFTVHNVGSSALTLGSVNVPVGFRVTHSLVSSLAAGESDYLTILFDSTSTGFREGVVSIVSNDADESPFVFPVSGEVRARCTEAPVLSSVRTDVSAVTQPETISIDATASNAVTRVEFYRDINRNDIGDPGEYLGEDRVFGRDGWRLENISTAGWSHTFLTTILAIGYDDCGNSSPWDDGAASDMIVHAGPASPELGSLSVNPNPVGPSEVITLHTSTSKGTINRVDFYRDIDQDGFGDVDELLGTDLDGTDGWQLAGVSTAGWSRETTVRLLASATDQKSWASNTVSVVPAVTIIDDGEPGFVAGDGFFRWRGGHQGDFLYASRGTGSETAAWNFTNLPTGRYAVWTTWKPARSRPTDAPYTISDDLGVRATVRLDQNQDPDDLTADGASWETLGTYDVVGQELHVVLSNDVKQRWVIADAVRIERIGDVVLAPEVDVLLNGTSISDGGSVDLGETTVGTAVDHVFTVRNRGAADLVLAAMDSTSFPAGITLALDIGSTTLARSESTTFTLRVTAAAEAELSGALALGNNDSGENPFDINFTARVVPVSTVTIIDDGEPGFSATTGWRNWGKNGGHDGNYLYIGGGSGTQVASWTFSNLDVAEYGVWATWRTARSRPVDAPYSIFDDDKLLETIAVNQRVNPDDQVTEDTFWEKLGDVDIVDGTLKVELTNKTSSSWVIADAIRIEKLSDITPAPEISVSNSLTGTVADAGTFHFGNLIKGTTVEMEFEIENTGTADLTLAAIQAADIPTGFSLASNIDVTTLARMAKTSFTVSVDTSSLGTLSGTLKFANNDGDENPFEIVLTATVVEARVSQTVDNGGNGFSAGVGFRNYSRHGGYGADYHYARDGDGSTVARWTFDNVTAGKYRIWTTWRVAALRPSDAPYTVLDGNTSRGTVRVDQGKQPADLSADGTSWKLLGDFDMTGGSLHVDLSNDADQRWVIADAVRIERIGDSTL